MSPAEIGQVLSAVDGVRKTMDTGFERVHKKIDEKFDNCDERLGIVETKMAIKKALCDQKKERRDYWKFSVRAVTIAGVIALLSIAWEKITKILDLVP